MPVAEPMVAIVGELLLQLPPVEVSLKVMDWPTHTLPGPVIGERLPTAITVLVAHPVEDVNEMEAVPALMPVTIPEVASTLTVASGLDHVPVPEVLVNKVDCPWHTEVAPAIAEGDAFTLTISVA